MVRIPVKMKEPLKNELEEFVRSIREGEPPPVTGEDAIKSLEIALLAEESGRKHQVLEL
jgi:predicted dehydrogenase